MWSRSVEPYNISQYAISHQMVVNTPATAKPRLLRDLRSNLCPEPELSMKELSVQY